MWNGTAATLNPNPTSQQGEADEEHRTAGQPERADLHADLAQVGGGRGAVHQRDPVQQEP